MTASPFKSAIEAAAARLREKAMTEEEGAFIGNEDNLQTALGVSRATVRQAARILEGEGMLRVRRGINGGYFAARPSADTIEKSVSAYLETLNVAGEDLLTIASVLWVEVLRKAAQIDTPRKREIIARYRGLLDTLPPDTGHREVLEVEAALRNDIFELIDSRYIELIFHINMAFSERRFVVPDEPEAPEEIAAFVAAWRNARRMELSAMADGDGELAALAARHMRNIWQQQMRKRIA
ncbi:MAG TPA: GntR family transcriptional regulator [Sphingobium sp.]